jgi:RNA polymerase sigma-70 factor, ECF subfamily
MMLAAAPWWMHVSGVGAPSSGQGPARVAEPMVPLPSSKAPQVDASARALFEAHYDFVWRSLRGLGVPSSTVDDGAQQVFCLAFRKMGEIRPGSERAFLFRLASGVASNARRSVRRRRELGDDERIGDLATPGPGPEELASRGEAREMLQAVLGGMPEDLRVAFMLFELEELEIPEIAAALEIPIGTVGSRLRRAREKFQEGLERVRKASSPRRAP